MFKTSSQILLAAALALCSCQRATSTSSQLHGENKAVNMQVYQDITEGTEVFFILLNQKIVPLEKNPPDSFYVKGTITSKKFKPQSQVLGIGELATAGRYGWLELNTLDFHPMESDRKADTPFVKGYMTPKGFVPSLREVIDTP
jgi:hypothetical protein